MLVSATSVLVTNNDEKVVKLFYIYYPIQFQAGKWQKCQGQESQEQIKALLKNGSKINAMSPAYLTRLGFRTWKINVRAEKIDGCTL